MAEALFARLDLAPSASEDEVHAAYKQKLRELSAKGQPLEGVKEAHRILSDSNERAAFLQGPMARPILSIGHVEKITAAGDHWGSEKATDGRRAYGYAGIQGKRRSMEDALILGASAGEGTHVWGVLDGHGGRTAADYLATMLPEVCGGLPLFDDERLPAEATAAYEALDRRPARAIHPNLLNHSGQNPAGRTPTDTIPTAMVPIGELLTDMLASEPAGCSLLRQQTAGSMVAQHCLPPSKEIS
mgnify:CR=1 FL=1